MSRKNTIIIAVLVNAGLLLLLLVTSLTREEGTMQGKIDTASLRPDEFTHVDPVVEAPLEKTLVPSAAPALATIETVKPEEPEVIYKIPPLVEEKKEVAVEREKKVNSTSLPEPSQERIEKIMVKKGDSLERIAKRHQTTVAHIIRLNKLPNTFLRIGQVLKVPSSSSKQTVEKSEKKGEAEYYIVQNGDSPWTIAMKHHLKVEELLRLNNLDEAKARKLRPGNRLRIR